MTSITHAPDFTLPDQYSVMRSLNDFLATGPVVLFFYPGANTPICTKEACHFRDLADSFAVFHASRVGISGDSVAKQAQFSTAQQFDYPVLSDVTGKVAQQFGVKRSGLLAKVAPVKRVTFVIAPDSTILGTVHSELNANNHAEEALAILTKYYAT